MRKYLLLLPFFLSFFMINNTFAVSDFTQTFNWDTLSSMYFCGGDSGRNCSDYSYFISEPSSSCSGSGAAYYVSGIGGFSDNALISICNIIIFPVSNSSQIYLTGGKNLASRYSGDFTVTLTDSFGEPCPDPEPCPAVPETPYAEKFDNIEKAIYVCGAILIMLYFFYCIYRMIIKGSGVN